MPTEYGTFSNSRVIRTDILVDPSLNSRKTVDEKKIEKLAQSIKVQGQIHPCLLIRSAQLGEEYASRAPYVLVCGFRRQLALDINAKNEGMEESKQEADYRIAPVEWGLAEAITANLTENLAREDLSTYELAMQCLELRDRFKMSAKDISVKVKAYDSELGDKKPLSESHINNMIRCASSLHPEILAAWQDQHPKASLRTLIQLSAEKDADKQLAMWRGVERPEEDEEDTSRQGGEGESSTGDKEKTAKRPTAPQLLMMIEAVKAAGKEGKKDDSFVKGAVAALRYAAGLAASIPGVKVETEED